jgi:hypothetical protein
VFFPAYNDAPSLPALIQNTFEVLRSHVDDYEVIVVNDGSFDNTGEVLAGLERDMAARCGAGSRLPPRIWSSTQMATGNMT